MTLAIAPADLRAAIDRATVGMTPAERAAVAERLAARVRARNRPSYARPGLLAARVDDTLIGGIDEDGTRIPGEFTETPALLAVDRGLTRALERRRAGLPARLAVFMPPQEGKSRRVTIAGPLWLWSQDPSLRIGIVSFESGTAGDFGREVRNIIVAHGGGTRRNPRDPDDNALGYRLREDSTSVSRFNLAGQRGALRAVGMAGGLTGRPLDVLIIDDPYKGPEQANSAKHRAAVWRWWTGVAVPRLPPNGIVILVQTRWHADDIGGTLIRQDRMLPPEARMWDVVNIPAQAEAPRPDDPNWLPDTLGRAPGVYMESTRGRTPDDWQRRRTEVGEIDWAALHQQRPTPPEGAVFKWGDITRHRRASDFETPRALTAVAVDTSAGGHDEAGVIGGYRGRDGRRYVTHDRSGVMGSEEWARAAWLLCLDTGADDLVWEANLAGPTMRKDLTNAWSRIVAQARTLDAVRDDLGPDALLEAILTEASVRRAVAVQALPRDQVREPEAEVAQLREVWTRLDLVLSTRESGPATLRPVRATVGKRTRATPVARDYGLGKVSHVGLFPELEQQMTTWEEGQDSPDRMDALVWLDTHLAAIRSTKSTSRATGSIPTGPTARA